MTVDVVFKFNSVEEAIVFLGKHSKAAGTTIVDGKPRKGRNDKGKPRKGAGAEPKSEGGAAGAQPGSAASTAAPTAAASPEASTTTAAPAVAATGLPAHEAETGAAKPEAATVTEEAVQKAIGKMFETAPPKGGPEAALKVLAGFGVRKVREVPAGQRAAVIAAVEKALA